MTPPRTSGTLGPPRVRQPLSIPGEPEVALDRVGPAVDAVAFPGVVAVERLLEVLQHRAYPRAVPIDAGREVEAGEEFADPFPASFDEERQDARGRLGDRHHAREIIL